MTFGFILLLQSGRQHCNNSVSSFLTEAFLFEELWPQYYYKTINADHFKTSGRGKRNNTRQFVWIAKRIFSKATICQYAWACKIYWNSVAMIVNKCHDCNDKMIMLYWNSRLYLSIIWLSFSNNWLCLIIFVNFWLNWSNKLGQLLTRLPIPLPMLD